VDRQAQLGGNEAAGRGGDVELGDRRVVLGGYELSLSREQLLLGYEHVEHGARAGQGLLLNSDKRDLRGAGRHEGRDRGARCLQRPRYLPLPKRSTSA